MLRLSERNPIRGDEDFRSRFQTSSLGGRGRREEGWCEDQPSCALTYEPQIVVPIVSVGLH